MKALVAGSTGETGRRIVSELVKREIPVRVLVRDIAKAKEILPNQVEFVQGDLLEPATLQAVMEGCTVVLSAAGVRPNFDPTGPYRVDLEGTKNLINVAKAKGIEHFVLVSSMCVSQFFHPLNLFWLILFWKKQAEEYLQKSGLVYTIVRPGGLKNEDNDDAIVMKKADSLFDGSIPRQKVAQVCVAALTEPSSHNKIVEVIAKPDEVNQSIPELFASV